MGTSLGKPGEGNLWKSDCHTFPVLHGNGLLPTTGSKAEETEMGTDATRSYYVWPHLCKTLPVKAWSSNYPRQVSWYSFVNKWKSEMNTTFFSIRKMIKKLNIYTYFLLLAWFKAWSFMVFQECANVPTLFGISLHDFRSSVTKVSSRDVSYVISVPYTKYVS